jgi:hypothetical protein
MPKLSGVLFDERFLDLHAGSIVSDTSVPVVELVANAWDAYATEVAITWPNSRDGTRFSMVDNGKGVGIPADFSPITSPTWRIANLSVGIQVPLRKTERWDRSGAQRGLVTPGDIIPEWGARSSRNGGRHRAESAFWGATGRNPSHSTRRKISERRVFSPATPHRREQPKSSS